MRLADLTPVIVRTAAILTDAYVAGTVINDCQDYNQIDLLVDYTQGSLTSVQIKVEFSEDNSTFFRETDKTISGGSTVLTVKEYTYTGGDEKLNISIPINCRAAKISAKGTGTVTDSSLAITALKNYV